jgi:putative GTP pyrophosphokinase
MPELAAYEALLVQYDNVRHNLRIFMDGIASYIGTHPRLILNGKEIVHSYKSRLKDREHLRAKLIKKAAAGRDI